MRAMDRLYLENSTFEHIESFASVFLGMVEPNRRIMTYCNAGHEPAIVVHPQLEPEVLAPTAPIIGVFDDQHHLFRQGSIELWPGSLLVATTDGVTEVRNDRHEFFGMEGLIDCVRRHRDDEPPAIVDAIIAAISRFSERPWGDDAAILVARFV